MISNAAWQTILTTANDLSTLVEVYAAAQTPSADGFDPADAIGLYAKVNGIEYLGYPYTRLVDSIGSINRTCTAESNTAEVTFSNVNRTISRFEFTNGFEGLILVIRLISRSLSDTIAKSQILFTGRCLKPTDGSKDTLTVSAEWILGGLEIQIPRRRYAREDPEGRVEGDDNYEGFIFTQQFGTSTYSVREKRGGFFGLFGFKHTVQKTLAYSSVSDLDANKPVPEVFGIAQLQGTHIGYDDTGYDIRMCTAFCEGPVYALGSNGTDATRPRSNDPRFPLYAPSYGVGLGVAGSANTRDLTWVAPGYYSHTAYTRSQAVGSSAQVYDPAPDLISIITGRTMTVPDGTGAWVTADTWTNNGAAHTRFILTSPYYFNLDENWIDDDEFYTCWNYNAEEIVDKSLNDFIFVVDGN